MSFEEAIHLVPRPNTQQPPCLRYGESPRPDAFQGDRFQRSVRHAARIGAELTGKILGDFELNLHGGFYAIILQALPLRQRQYSAGGRPRSEGVTASIPSPN